MMVPHLLVNSSLLGLEITIFIDKWVYVGSTSNLNAGEGFTMKGTSEQMQQLLKGSNNQEINNVMILGNLMMAQLQYQ
jgi:hypothetical protein